jgi:hypothetical protein
MEVDAGGTRPVGWGYSWCDAICGEASGSYRVYLEKTKIPHGSDEIGPGVELSEEEIRVLEAESDISYFAGQYVPENSRFDEETNDLIYSSEEEDLSHEAEFAPWRLQRMAP